MVDKLNHTRPGDHQKALEIPSFQDDEKLCVVNCLRDYVTITEDLRENGDQLLLCCARSHGPASKYTVSRWLRAVLSDSGIRNFAPHSFRGAAASAMLNSGLVLGDILKSAGWSNASTFYKFYNRSVELEAMLNSGLILDDILKSGQDGPTLQHFTSSITDLLNLKPC